MAGRGVASGIPADVLSLGKRLAEAGDRTWLVGGCVRDRLIGRTPRDWDITTSASEQVLRERFERVERLGGRGETFLVFAASGAPPREVTSFAGTSLEAELCRRDFTVNALALPLPPPPGAAPHDPAGGAADLAARVLRAVEDPDARFSEDPLRPLRGVRLEAEIGLVPEPATLAAMARHGPGVTRAASERIRDEFLRILATFSPSRAIERMRGTGMLAAILPELAATVGVTQNRHHRLDIYRHSLAALDFAAQSQAADPILRLAVLLHDIGKPTTRKMLHEEPSFIGHEIVGAAMAADRARALRLPEAEVERIRDLVRHHLVRYTPRWSDRALRRFLRRVRPERVQDLLCLYAADARAKDPHRFQGMPVPEEVAGLEARIRASLSQAPALHVRDLAVGGQDVIETLGVPAGPVVGRALEALLERVIVDPAMNNRGRLIQALREMGERTRD